MEPLHNQRGVDEHTKTAKPNTERVGYSNPPKHTRFKTGQSGNPRGRPKGALNMATVLARTLRSTLWSHKGAADRALRSWLNQNLKFSSVRRERRVTKAPHLGRTSWATGELLINLQYSWNRVSPHACLDFPVNSLFAYCVGIRVSRNPHQQRAFHEITTSRSLNYPVVFPDRSRTRDLTWLCSNTARASAPLPASSTWVRLTPAWRRERSTIFRITEESSMIRARTAGIRAPSVGRAGRYLLLYACVFPFAISARSERSLDGELGRKY